MFQSLRTPINSLCCFSSASVDSFLDVSSVEFRNYVPPASVTLF